MKKRIIDISILLATGCGIAFPQTERQLLPSEIKQLTIVQEPATLNKGFFRAGLTGSNILIDKYFDKDGKKLYAPESSWATSRSVIFIGQYGITDRLMVDVMIPWVNERRNYSSLVIAPGLDTDLENNWDLKGSGIGDMVLSTSYQIITESQNMPSLRGELGLTVPTGRKNPTDIKDSYDFVLPTGYGEFVVDAWLKLRKIIYPFSYAVYTRYSHSLGGQKLFQASDTEERKFRSGSRIDAGGSINFLLNDWIALANELNFYYSGEGTRENAVEGELSTSWAFSYEPRLIFQIRQFRVGEAVRIPLKGKSTGSDPLFVILVQYVF